MKAIVLIGHGSILSDSGAAMMRLAAHLKQQGIAPIVEAGFLNYSQPTLAAAIASSVEQGATALTIQPYFLVDGKYVREDLRAEITRAADQYPQVQFAIAGVFGQHRLLADIVFDRVCAADPALGTEGRPAGLLLMAHGTPYPEANAPLERIAARVHARTDYCRVLVGYLECNRPTIDEAIDQLVADGTIRLVALPYFLHAGRHVQRDLPRILQAAQQRHPQTEMHLAPYLGDDLRITEVIADRVRETQAVDRLAPIR